MMAVQIKVKAKKPHHVIFIMFLSITSSPIDYFTSVLSTRVRSTSNVVIT